MKLLKSNDVMEAVTRLEDLRIQPEPTTPKARGIQSDEDPGYDCVSLKTLKFTSAGTVSVPGMGLLEMTQWAKRQLGLQIGVRFDTFFNGMDPDKINRAIQDHFNAQTQVPVQKIIARRNLTSKTKSDGILRGFVSPTYSEVKDQVLVEKIIEHAQNRSVSFSTFDLRDNGSHFCLVGKNQIDLTGRVKPAPELHGVRVANIGYPGIRIRNSEVGSYSLTADAYILRLVCINGAIIRIDEQRIFKHKHRGIDSEVLEGLVSELYRSIPNTQEATYAAMKTLQGIRIDDVTMEIEQFLRWSRFSDTVCEAVKSAYAEEPDPTAFGVFNAITRTAMAIRENPDRQFDMEHAAGRYVSWAQRHRIERAA